MGTSGLNSGLIQQPTWEICKRYSLVQSIRFTAKMGESILSATIRGRMLVRTMLTNSVALFMVQFPCLCWVWCSALSTKDQALLEYDQKNFMAFQAHSQTMFTTIRNGYKCGVGLILAILAMYLVFFLIMIATADTSYRNNHNDYDHYDVNKPILNQTFNE